MDWLEPALRNVTYGYIAGGVAAAALVPGLIASLFAAWFGWRSAHLNKLARRNQGRKQLAEEQLSGFDQEEKDLQRMMKEIEKSAAKG